MRPQPVLLALVALLPSSVFAQDPTTADDDATTDVAESSAQTTAESTTAADDDTDTALPALTTTSPTTAAGSTRTTDPPALTSTAPPLPTISGTSAEYSYPAPTVPPTNNAPYMQPSSIPDGTVFIAVGAILGAFGVAVLVWRAVVACLLHRSVKRAALAQHAANDKASYPAPSAPFYNYTDHASSASLGNMAAGRGVRRTQRGPIPSATPSQSNLFFSPTAAPDRSSVAGNRASQFLPSGFYAAGAGAPQQGHTHSISLTNLRPDSRGNALSPGYSHSPDDSPSLAPRSDMGRRNMSSSTLNLNRPLSQRAPSAYLEDLLADQPDQFPPQGHNPSWNPQGRF
ncbi:hypothetical protein F4778DRAFT_713878 [Xylariomycetidae sp. FL2044]|nr:hypothetical protein F4778DRAFT_713878 [Xylariomycetidae sp. FL2044]